MIYGVEIVSVEKLRPHEEIDSGNYNSLLREIQKNQYVEPILVDSKTNIILDGHHRYHIMKALGHKEIPAFMIDYDSSAIQVKSWKNDLYVSKEEVIRRALSSKLYPPKTSRHLFQKPKIKIPLKEASKMKADSVLDLIGNTPVVRINNLNKNNKVTIYAKLEGQNIGGSVKDRIALSMINAAEKSGELTKDKIILEPTSGNTGIGLSMVAAVKGYKITLTMSAGMSEERKRILRAFGAELVETDTSLGTDGAIFKARELLRENPEKYWMPNQYDNPNNPLAHYNGTANEILEQVPDITAFVGGMGTSGTLMGVHKRLKEFNKNIQIIGAEPQSQHMIQGLKNMKEAIIPKIFDESKLDGKIVVQNEDAYETARQLALKEGIFVGMSSGAAMWAALKHAEKMKEGTIVVILPDRGEKYVSTGLFK